MAMSLKQEIETWVDAIALYDNNEFEESLRSFGSIADTSKIIFNCGVIHATLGQHGIAVECYQRAIALDQYLAVAYFQQGVSNFLIGDFEEALANFNDALLYLRGNNFIDYQQLGLNFKLYSCEVLFNRGLCYIYLQQKEAGLHDFSFAVREKVVEDHNVIDDAIREEAEGYTVFSIPVGVIFRPNNAKVRNLKTKDYLGKARLIASLDRSNTHTGFSGSEKRAGARDRSVDDRPPDTISFAASHMVKSELRSRARQQSAPPMDRTVLPPTPPPESEKPGYQLGSTPERNSSPAVTQRSSPVRGPPPVRPERLDVQTQEQPRLGTIRTASEPRGPSRTYSDRRQQDLTIRTRKETPLRQLVESGGEQENDESPSELHEIYHQPQPRLSIAQRRARSRSNLRPRSIEEESASETQSSSSPDDDRFEMLPPLTQTRARGPSRAASRKPEIRRIRVKVHAADTRYIMIAPVCEFAEFVGLIQQKFELGPQQHFKCLINDEGDMITMSDQDDLDMAIANSVSEARNQRDSMGKMGKMEIWAQLY